MITYLKCDITLYYIILHYTRQYIILPAKLRTSPAELLETSPPPKNGSPEFDAVLHTIVHLELWKSVCYPSLRLFPGPL